MWSGDGHPFANAELMCSASVARGCDRGVVLPSFAVEFVLGIVKSIINNSGIIFTCVSFW